MMAGGSNHECIYEQLHDRRNLLSATNSHSMYRNDFLQEIQIYRFVHHLGIDVYCLSCH